MNQIEQKVEIAGIKFMWAKFKSKSPKEAALVINICTALMTLCGLYVVAYGIVPQMQSVQAAAIADHVCIVAMSSSLFTAIGVKANTTADPTLLSKNLIDNINTIITEVKQP